MNVATPTLELLDQVGLVLLHFLWQGFAVAAAYAIIQFAVTSPRVRSAAAAFSLAVMLALPVITFPRLEPARSEPVGQPSLVAAIGETAGLKSQAVAAQSGLALPPLPVGETWNWRAWVAMAWMAGVAILAFRLTRGWWCLRCFRRSGIAVDDAGIVAVFRKALEEVGVRGNVSLLSHAGISVPVTFGWLKPVILLPASALTGLPIGQLELILTHELAHIRRRDYLVNLLQAVAETMLFFHPAVWWLSRQLRREREFACDDVVTAFAGNRFDYARALTDLETHRRWPETSLSSAASDDCLRRRVERILNARGSRKTSPSLIGLVTCLAAALALFGGSLFAENEGEEESGKTDWSAYHTKDKEAKLAQEILAMPEGDLKLLALSGLVRRWIESDTEAAWEFGETLKEKKLRVTYYRAAAPYLAKEDPGKILEKFVQGRWWPDQWVDIRDATIKMADYDLDRAIEIYVESTPERMQIGEVARQLAIRLVKRDSAEAGLEFAKRLERPEANSGAIQGTLQSWVTLDEAAAITYAEDIEDEYVKSFAVSGLLTGKPWLSQPDETVAWMVSLADDDIRRTMLVNFAWLWNGRDEPAQIRRLLENELIAVEDINYIRERLEKMSIFVPE